MIIIDNIFIADSYNYVIRKVTALTGIITSVAGTGTSGYAGDNGEATSATIAQSEGLATDSSGSTTPISIPY